MGVPPGNCLCLFESPKEASCAGIQPGRTAAGVQAGLILCGTYQGETCGMPPLGTREPPSLAGAARSQCGPTAHPFSRGELFVLSGFLPALLWLPKQRTGPLSSGEVVGRPRGSFTRHLYFFFFNACPYWYPATLHERSEDTLILAGNLFEWLWAGCLLQG